MPELAEVQTLADQLQQHLAGQKIKVLTIHHEGLLQTGNPQEASEAKITEVRRWGKRLVFVLQKPEQDPMWLVSGLGMTGGWIIREKPDNHCQAEIQTEKTTAWYTDPRKFGKMHLFSSPEVARATLGPRIGVDALQQMSVEQLQKHLGQSEIKLKAALLDQSRLSGIGNYLADEIAWDAAISPTRKTIDIQQEEWKRLNRSRIKIINRALQAQGLSFSDYRHADGTEGDMSRHLKAYGRVGQECFRCGNPMQKQTVAGRGTCWCPCCQK